MRRPKAWPVIEPRVSLTTAQGIDRVRYLRLAEWLIMPRTCAMKSYFPKQYCRALLSDFSICGGFQPKFGETMGRFAVCGAETAARFALQS